MVISGSETSIPTVVSSLMIHKHSERMKYGFLKPTIKWFMCNLNKA